MAARAKVFSSGAHDYEPAWSPDGRRLAFSRLVDGQWDIFVREIESCTSTVGDGGAIDAATLGARTFTVEANDEAGNSRTTSVTYTVVDETRPTITIATPADGAQIARGTTVTPDFACTDEDGGSGIESCEGGTVDTSAPGKKTFEVTATDRAGNTRTAVAAGDRVGRRRGQDEPRDHAGHREPRRGCGGGRGRRLLRREHGLPIRHPSRGRSRHPQRLDHRAGRHRPGSASDGIRQRRCGLPARRSRRDARRDLPCLDRVRRALGQRLQHPCLHAHGQGRGRNACG